MKVIFENYVFFLQGLKVTIILSLIVIFGGLLLGTILALCKISKKAFLKHAVSSYIDIIRGVPLIMVLFWFYFLLPILTGKPMPPILSAVVAMTCFVSAFYAEVIGWYTVYSERAGGSSSVNRPFVCEDYDARYSSSGSQENDPRYCWLVDRDLKKYVNCVPRWCH